MNTTTTTSTAWAAHMCLHRHITLTGGSREPTCHRCGTTGRAELVGTESLYPGPSPSRRFIRINGQIDDLVADAADASARREQGATSWDAAAQARRNITATWERAFSGADLFTV
jgi:hypothetical protein